MSDDWPDRPTQPPPEPDEWKVPLWLRERDRLREEREAREKRPSGIQRNGTG